MLLYLATTAGLATLRRYGLWRPFHTVLRDQVITAIGSPADHAETVFAATDGQIYQSTDSGATAKLVGETPNRATVWSLHAGPRESKQLLAGLDGGRIHISSDAGASWRPAGVPTLPNGPVTRFVSAGQGPATILAVAAGVVIATEDGGLTWTILDGLRAPVTHLVRHPDAAGTFYAAGPAGLHRTRNGGRSWQRLNPIAFDALLVHPQRPRTLIAALANGLHTSPNAGAHWHPIADGETDPADRVVDIIGSAAADLILAITERGKVLQIVDNRCVAPPFGPTWPVVNASVRTGDVMVWTAAPRRLQPRRRRPPRREDGTNATPVPAVLQPLPQKALAPPPSSAAPSPPPSGPRPRRPLPPSATPSTS